MQENGNECNATKKGPNRNQIKKINELTNKHGSKSKSDW